MLPPLAEGLELLERLLALPAVAPTAADVADDGDGERRNVYKWAQRGRGKRKEREVR